VIVTPRKAFVGVQRRCHLAGLLVGEADGEPVVAQVNVPKAFLKIEEGDRYRTQACRPQNHASLWIDDPAVSRFRKP